MGPIVIERRVDPPIAIADIPALEVQSAWCMEQHRVNHVISLLSLDGRQLVCTFDAPDAEAVRSVMRQLGVPITRTWPATVHAPPSLPVTAPLADGSGAPVVVVERSFPDPVEVASIQAIEDRGAWCLDQHRVRFLRTYFSADRRRMLCLYAAPDAESVRLAQRQAGMPLDRVWPALVYEATAPPG